VKRPMRAIARRLVDSQKRLKSIRGRADDIIKQAESIEEEAMRDQKQIRKKLQRSDGARRQILEAEYLGAIQRRKRAAQVSGAARVTRDKIGPATPLGSR